MKTKTRREVRPMGLTDSNYKERLQNCPLPVLACCKSEGCGPCRRMVPILQGIADDYKGFVRVANVDYYRCPRFVREYKIRYTPTLILFWHGRPLARFDRLATKSELAWLLRDRFGLVRGRGAVTILPRPPARRGPRNSQLRKARRRW